MSQKYKVYINNRPKIITENWNYFCAQYEIIKAAGGVVLNNENQLLMIFRNGKWDLPKGKLEVDEELEKCAIREVEEECGVNDLSIVDKIQDTYHVYSLKGKNILKHTSWFYMSLEFNKKFTPQFSEGITEVAWIDSDDINDKLTNSFENIKDLLKNNLSLIFKK